MPRHAIPQSIGDGPTTFLDLSELTPMELATLVTMAKDAENDIELARAERRTTFYRTRQIASGRLLNEAALWRAEVRSAFIRKFFEVRL